MKIRLVAGVASLTLAPLGLVAACTVPTKLLACTASPDVAHPAPTSFETVTTKTAPGATVVSTWHFQHSTTRNGGVANAAGLAKQPLHLIHAASGYRVGVTVMVTKGLQQGTCSTSFTPQTTTGALGAPPATTPSQSPPTPPAPVIHLSSVSWLVNPNGTTLAYYPAFPAGVCSSIPHQSNITGAEACGQVIVGLDLTGLAPYEEPIRQPVPNVEPFGSSNFTGSIDLNWQLTCSLNNTKTYGTASVGLGGDLGAEIAWAGNMNGADKSNVSLYANVNFGDSLSRCDGPSVVTSLTATGIRVLIDDSYLPASPTSFAGTWSS